MLPFSVLIEGPPDCRPGFIDGRWKGQAARQQTRLTTNVPDTASTGTPFSFNLPTRVGMQSLVRCSRLRMSMNGATSSPVAW